MAQKDAPKIVSGLVVKTFNVLKPMFEFFIRKLISAPSDFPIQLDCIIFTFAGQLSSLSRPVSSSSEYALIFKNHWDNFFCSTIALDRHPRPSITCSFAKTVWSTGSQLTKDSFL